MRRFGLIGHPLGHSFSKSYFERKFQNLGLEDHSYDLFEMPSAVGFEQLSLDPELVGLNVTIPHKSSIISFLHDLSESARTIGAVNCLSRVDEQWIGHNTDAPAFQATLEPLLHGKTPKTLVLGTGGSSKAVVYALKKMGIIALLVSRTKKENSITYSDLNQDNIAEYGLIINCTPVGMYPNVDLTPPLPSNGIQPGQLIYDLIYNPEETKLLTLAKAGGAKIKNGLQMLEKQAELAWEIWNP